MALVVVSLVALCIGTVSSSARQSPPPGPPQGGTQGAAQDRQFPPLTFKVEVNYVEVGAVVLDRQGRFVGDLQRDDFQVFEDGKPQGISAFTLVE